MYTVTRDCSWKDHHWSPGDTLDEGDGPAAVLRVLKRSKSVVPAFSVVPKVTVVNPPPASPPAPEAQTAKDAK